MGKIIRPKTTEVMPKGYAPPPKEGPAVLVFDLETWFRIVKVWQLGKQYVGPDQIVDDVSIMAFAAKWLGSPASDIMYSDVRAQRDYRDDRRLCRVLALLLDQADIVLTQNGKSFDEPLLLARLAINNIPAPKPVKHIDTKRLADQLGFSSSRLAYLTDTLNKKYKKLDHGEFPGRKLWDECEARNPKAWAAMEKYNKHDVLATEELYNVLAPRTRSGISFDLYREGGVAACNCGSSNFRKKGYAFTPGGKFQIYNCRDCNSWVRGTENLLSKDKRASLKKGIA